MSLYHYSISMLLFHYSISMSLFHYSISMSLFHYSKSMSLYHYSISISLQYINITTVYQYHYITTVYQYHYITTVYHCVILPYHMCTNWHTDFCHCHFVILFTFRAFKIAILTLSLFHLVTLHSQTFQNYYSFSLCHTDFPKHNFLFLLYYCIL